MKKSQKKDILALVKNEYGTEPDFPFTDDNETAVLRHSHNKKWYGLIMTIPKSRLGIENNEKCHVINLKCDPLMSGSIRMEMGIFPAYHMNKNSWISVILDGTVPMEQIKFLIEISYQLTKSKRKAVAKKSDRGKGANKKL